jgi:uncharacterized protein (TIGR00369 family)
MKLIGAEIIDLKQGYCEIHMKYMDKVAQQHGYFHAGIIGTLADTAGGYAAFKLMDSDSSILTVEYKLNLLAPGEGESLVSRSHVVKTGRTITVSNAEVYVKRNNVEVLCGIVTITLIQ